MKQILKTNEPNFNVGFFKSRRFLFDIGNLSSRQSPEPFQAGQTFMRRAPKAVKLIRRIIVSWVAGPPFQPKLHSAVPIYPCVLNSRIKRRMIRQHMIF
jgi:hypothetical protein